MEVQPNYNGLQFRFTRDMRLVQSFLADPRCYHRMKNDDAPLLEQFDITKSPAPGILFVVAYDLGAIAEALFLLCDSPEGHDTAEIHFCIAPTAWGRSEPIAREFLKWLWEHTSIERLIGKLPAYNRLARKLAMKVGFRECGACWKCKKNGQVYDIERMVLGRPKK